eukprot:scaffold2318_cov396-Prasinococcus_capsulatus_cf.AAC.9
MEPAHARREIAAAQPGLRRRSAPRRARSSALGCEDTCGLVRGAYPTFGRNVLHLHEDSDGLLCFVPYPRGARAAADPAGVAGTPVIG